MAAAKNIQMKLLLSSNKEIEHKWVISVQYG